MRFVVDTNILVHAANRDSPEHAAAHGALSGWLTGAVPWCISWNLVYEFLRVVTHPRVFPRPLRAAEALEFIGTILENDLVTILAPTSRHQMLLTRTLEEMGRPAGNIFHDIHTAVLMREHGVAEIMTADAAFHQFKFLRVSDPTRK